jgi:phosphopantothenoylcysteine decarboxylase/phosphopantothenoylcysteine decarboxylase/phosphopantothenate--cysteine ligase
MSEKKHVIIGVTGGIAAYRACDLIRALTCEGIPVTVIMTHGAEQFVGKITFESLTGREVFSDPYGGGMPHIDLKNRAGLLAIVPATANIIGKFANGIADDLVSSTYLASTCPIIVAPAMNPNMYAHPAVKRNIETLRRDGVIVVEPETGKVVCGDEGTGKLASVDTIYKIIKENYR